MSASIVSRNPHLVAVLQALLVTFLWSTSWVLIKVGLKDISPLTFAGLRYTLAFLCLLPLMFRAGRRAEIAALSRRDWLWLGLLGIVFYSATQGAQFLALKHLPAVTLSLLLNFTVIVTALLGMLLAERPNAVQWVGIGVFLAGVVIYFYPIDVPANEVLGLGFAGIGVVANAVSAILGRYINRDKNISPLTVTVVSMGIGSVAMLGAGVLTEGLPTLSPSNLLLVLWLAVVNTAFAFTLWNQTLRTLSAVESGVINNTMLIQIAILVWLFLGEKISEQEILGMVIAVVGILVVQLRRT
jgi:drug/metabolite transporter (DMT)-like permease